MPPLISISKIQKKNRVCEFQTSAMMLHLFATWFEAIPVFHNSGFHLVTSNMAALFAFVHFTEVKKADNLFNYYLWALALSNLQRELYFQCSFLASKKNAAEKA